jgi:hypothetical protein
MGKKTKIFLAALVLLILAAATVKFWDFKNSWLYERVFSPSPSASPVTSDEGVSLVVSYPEPGQKITSPLKVSGIARGSWFFEAEFPIKLNGSQGQVLGTAIARAQDEWMTNDFVPFEAELTFAENSGQGTLILEKSNPSGLPENAGEFAVPVKF